MHYVPPSLNTQLDQLPPKARGRGLWIVEADSKEAVHQLMQSDPFWTCGLRERVEVLHWSKALDQQVLV